MIKVTNIEQVNGIPCVKARVVFIDMGDMMTGDFENAQVFGDRWSRIILVSDTEPLPKQQSCKVYNSYSKITDPVDNYYATEELKPEGIWLLLADSKDISPASLELIRAAQIKEGDEVWLECESSCNKHRTLMTDVDAVCTCTVPQTYQVKLDQDGHVIIHQQEKPRLYTTEEVIDLLAGLARHVHENGFGPYSISRHIAKDWLKGKLI